MKLIFIFVLASLGMSAESLTTSQIQDRIALLQERLTELESSEQNLIRQRRNETCLTCFSGIGGCLLCGDLGCLFGVWPLTGLILIQDDIRHTRSQLSRTQTLERHLRSRLERRDFLTQIDALRAHAITIDELAGN